MNIIKYQCGYKYQIQDNATITLPKEWEALRCANDWIALEYGLLRVKAGYAWDGASGPTIDSKCSMRASLAHDALYQLMREGLISRDLKDKADDLLRDLCREDGMSIWRAWLWHRAVKQFGLSATIRNRDILVAP